MSMPTDYTQVFYDNFSGTKLNSSNWPLTYGGASGTGPFSYSSSDIHVDNGLTISTTDTSSGWTTGGLSQGSKGGTYGLYQVEAKVGSGQGTGPAIVLWPTDNNWPGGGEIDLLEAPDGKEGTMTLHWENSSGGDSYYSFSTQVDASQWHDYAVDWEPNQLTFYVDGKAMWSTTQHIPTDQMSLGLAGYVAKANDTWYGGGPNSSTPSTVNTQIAWVSISKPSASGSSATSTSALVSSADAPKFYAGPGNDVLTGTTPGEWFFVNPSDSDGWAEIDKLQSGDKLALWNTNLSQASVTWEQATDKNGVSGATAEISLHNNGHIDEAVTVAGVSVATAQSWTHYTSSAGGIPFAVFQT